jgi:hypothetical protein
MGVLRLKGGITPLFHRSSTPIFTSLRLLPSARIANIFSQSVQYWTETSRTSAYVKFKAEGDKPRHYEH